MRSARLILEGQAGSCRDKVRRGNVSLAQGADYGAEETDDATSNVAAHGAGQTEETLLCVAADVAEPRAWQTASARERQRTRSVMVGQSTGGGSRWGSDLKKGLDASWVDGISWTTLAQQLETMQVSTSEGEGSMGEIRLIDLNIAKAAARLGRFRRAAVVVQIFEISPSRDRVVAWVQDTMEIRLGVAVRIVKWENRQSIKLTANMKVAWVELRDLPPFLEDQVETMLGVLGPIVHHSLEKQNEMKYANVRVGILVDVSLDLPQFVGIKTPWEKTYLQPVVYTRLPDRCFLCQGKGHWARSCPKKRNGETRGDDGANEVRVDTEVAKSVSGLPDNEFTPVHSKSKTKVGVSSSRSREEQGVQGNRFAVLDDNEDADMVIAADDEDQLPKGDLVSGHISDNNRGDIISAESRHNLIGSAQIARS
ncbi:hypothetical protein R1sor_025724 [Riccia sorocarpa]|uniref:CCHC-type domain-containing protein n=1 Tax=Riccia sorocarpa TaxID=122646 RepID=A0ABD3GD32_9MARC